MFSIKCIFYFIRLNFILGIPQFNLYYTDLVSKSNNTLQYNCLHIITYTRGRNIANRQKLIINPETDITNHEIMSYCMNEFSPKFHNEEKTNQFQKFTFYNLSKENIRSEQLYLWSAPIDLIENYQFYLNQLSTSADLSLLSQQIFYNCTLPRFGLQCQYEFDYYHSNFSSLNELIHKFYTTNVYDPTTLTCYKHLKCFRGPYPACLDWSEICNGQIDCTDSGLDEEHCWQLEINQCNDDQYQCDNGQCIPKMFYQDDKNIFDCLDASDEILRHRNVPNLCNRTEPAFTCEDRKCKENDVTSSCVLKRVDLLMNAIFSIKDNFTYEDCWFATKCMFDRLYSKEPSCHRVRADHSHRKTLLDTCSEMIFIPNYPILFGDSYIAVEKNHLKEMHDYSDFTLYVCYDHHSHYDSSIYLKSEILFNNRSCFNGGIFIFSAYDIGSEPMVKYYKFLNSMYQNVKRYRLFLNYTLTICNRSNMYQCINSPKCILIHRLFDGYCRYSPICLGIYILEFSV